MRTRILKLEEMVEQSNQHFERYGLGQITISEYLVFISDYLSLQENDNERIETLIKECNCWAEYMGKLQVWVKQLEIHIDENYIREKGYTKAAVMKDVAMLRRELMIEYRYCKNIYWKINKLYMKNINSFLSTN